jgi:hypothetical protein
VDLNLTTNGVFDLTGGGRVEHRFSASIAEALGMSTLDAFAVGLDPADVEVADLGTNGVGANASIAVEVLVGALDDEDVCAAGISLGRFDVVLGTNGEVSVEPAQLPASASALNLVSAGDFEMCLSAASALDQTLNLEQITLLLDTTAPLLNCSELVALAQVQDALDFLADEGFSFELRRGSEPLDITGRYSVTHAVEFDPDGSDEGDLPSRTDVFSGQADGVVVRATGRAELDQFIVGTETSVSLCTLARTSNPECDQTIARLESYDVGTNGVDLEGGFLAVVIERHPSADSQCGPVGDFIFGSIALIPQDTAEPAPTDQNDNPDNGLEDVLDMLPSRTRPKGL